MSTNSAQARREKPIRFAKIPVSRFPILSVSMIQLTPPEISGSPILTISAAMLTMRLPIRISLHSAGHLHRSLAAQESRRWAGPRALRPIWEPRLMIPLDDLIVAYGGLQLTRGRPVRHRYGHRTTSDNFL